MRQVVHLEGEFKAVFGGRLLWEDAARVQGQQVDARKIIQQPVSQRRHLAEAGKIGDVIQGAQVLGHLLRLVRVAANHRHLPAVPGQLPGGLLADAVAGPGDQRCLHGAPPDGDGLL